MGRTKHPQDIVPLLNIEAALPNGSHITLNADSTQNCFLCNLALWTKSRMDEKSQEFDGFQYLQNFPTGRNKKRIVLPRELPVPFYERHSLKIKLQELGGELVDEEFMGSATHVVGTGLSCYSPVFLEALARGLWVVNKNYITQSYVHHTWLQELFYEVTLEPHTEGYATRRNREKALVKRESNFASWKIGVLFDDHDPTSKGVFSRLLEAGGATYFLREDMDLHTSYEYINWVLVCGLSANQKNQVNELAKMGITCLDLRFLTDTLLKRCVEPMDKYIFKTNDEMSCKAHDQVFNRIMSHKLKKRKKSFFQNDTPYKKRERIAVTVIWKGKRITIDETENCFHKNNITSEVKKSIFGCNQSLCDKWLSLLDTDQNCIEPTLGNGDYETEKGNLSSEDIVNYLIAHTKNCEVAYSPKVNNDIEVSIDEISNLSPRQIYCRKNNFIGTCEIFSESDTDFEEHNPEKKYATNILSKMESGDCELDVPSIQRQSLQNFALDTRDDDLKVFTGVDTHTPDENLGVQLYQGVIKRHNPSIDEESGFHSLEGEDKDTHEMLSEPIDTSVTRTSIKNFLSKDEDKEDCSEIVDNCDMHEDCFCIPLNLTVEKRPKLSTKKGTEISSYAEEGKSDKITHKCVTNSFFISKGTIIQTPIQYSVPSDISSVHLSKSDLNVEGNSSEAHGIMNHSYNSQCENTGECLTSDLNTRETKCPMMSTLSWSQVKNFHVSTSHEIATGVQKEIEAELDNPWKAFDVCGAPLCCKTSPLTMKKPSINVCSIFLSMKEQELWDPALNFFDMAVDSGILPDACAVQSLFDLVLDTHDDEILASALCCIDRLFRRYPPCSLHSRTYYNKVLASKPENYNLHPDGMVATLLDLLDDESSSGHEDSHIKLNSGTSRFKDLPQAVRFERIFMLLDCITNVLASDLGRWMQRHYLSEDKALWPERPLAESALRQWGQGMPLQSDLRLLFRVCLQLRHISNFAWNELGSVIRLVHLAAEVFRLNDENLNLAFPNFGHKCQCFADELLWQMGEFGLDNAGSVQFLSCVEPSWVAMLVGKKLLENILGESIKHPLLTVTCLLKERLKYVKRRNKKKDKHFNEENGKTKEETADHAPDGCMYLELTRSYKAALKGAPKDLQLILTDDSMMHDDKVSKSCWNLSSDFWMEISAILPILANSCLRAYNLIQIVSNYYTKRRRRSQQKIQSVKPRILGINTALQYRIISYQFCEMWHVVRKIKKFCREGGFHVSDSESIAILDPKLQKCLY